MSKLFEYIKDVSIVMQRYVIDETIFRVTGTWVRLERFKSINNEWNRSPIIFRMIKKRKAGDIFKPRDIHE